MKEDGLILRKHKLIYLGTSAMMSVINFQITLHKNKLHAQLHTYKAKANMPKCNHWGEWGWVGNRKKWRLESRVVPKLQNVLRT